MKKALNIFLMGPPASGKGTQANLLAKELNCKIISTGDFTRKISKGKDKVAKEARKAMISGGLIPNYLVTGFVQKELKKQKKDKGVVFDGYPRDIDQAEEGIKVFKEFGREKFLIFFITIPPKEIIKRVSLRLVCPKCKKVYSTHVDHIEKCKKCKVKLIQREDDKPKAIRNRIKEYNKRTKPVMNFFKKRGDRVVIINGNDTIDSVHKKIRQKVKA